MKYLPAIILFLFVLCSGYSQKPGTRSALGTGGSTTANFLPGGNFISQQSIGQSGVTGTFMSGDQILMQGFIRPPGFGQANIQVPGEPLLKAAVFPNPFSDRLTIYIEDEIDGRISLRVFNLAGKLVHSNEHNNTHEITVNFGHLPAGKYIIKINTEFSHFSATLFKD